MRKENSKSNAALIFCVESKEFEAFLRMACEKEKAHALFLTIEKVPRAIAENSESTLVLQSEINEGIFFDIGKKLKSVFFQDLKVIFLSFDYQIRADAQKTFSSFIQAPCPLDKILSEAKRISKNKKSILLIDDSKLVHKNLVGPLRDNGFNVEQAFNGKEGLRVAIEKSPDLIICDIEMPIMNGFEACTEIRNDPRTTNTYIIMSSTLKSAEDQRKGFAAGVDEYIPKPVVFEGLLERIKGAFLRKSSIREKILIIDRDANQSETIANYLGKQGFSTRIAQSLPDARRLLKKFSSDLILTEAEPLEGSIIDVSTICDLEYTNNDLAFIALIDQDNDADRRMALNAGAKDTVATPATSEALAAIVERTIAALRSERERGEFQRYVSKASFQTAMEKSVLGEISTKSRAEKRAAIVFFLDIEKFTGRCERYSPEEIVSQINNMFEKITEIITGEDGDIDKFMGDACMSFWFNEGDNLAHSKSVSAILGIKKAMQELNQSDPVLIKDPIKIRMGLNSGDVILCDLGASKARVDLTMIGDAVNISSRLETACSKYGIDNLVSASIMDDVKDSFVYRIIDRIKVYGKEKPLYCYEVLGRAIDGDLKLLEFSKNFNNAFELYSKGSFKEARELFAKTETFETKSGSNTNPSMEYLSRCEHLLENPPKNWEGIWVHDSK